MVTVSVAVNPPAVIVRVRVISPAVEGAVNVGVAVVAPVRVIVPPEVFAQEYVIVSPSSGSEEPLPSRDTEELGATRWSFPAFAVGARDTVMVTVSVASSPPSDIVRVKTKSPEVAGAVNDGFAAVLLDNCTVSPESCAQEYDIISLSGSLPVPLRVTTLLVGTVCVFPASAVGSLDTVTVTVSVEDRPPAVTVRVKTKSSDVAGAVNVGVAVSAPVRVTSVPESCVQEYVSERLLESDEPEPSRDTVVLRATFLSAPASAVGAADTVMVTVSVSEFGPSDTVNVNTMVPAEDGAVNVGFATVALDKDTAGPLVFAQEYVRESFSGSVDAEPSRDTEELGATI